MKLERTKRGKYLRTKIIYKPIFLKIQALFLTNRKLFRPWSEPGPDRLLLFLCQPRHADHPFAFFECDQPHPLGASSLNRDIDCPQANNFSLVGDQHQFVFIHDGFNRDHISCLLRSFHRKDTGATPILNPIFRGLGPLSIAMLP